MRTTSVAAIVAVIAGTLAGGAGFAAPVSKANMPSFCLGKVTAMYATKPAYVKLGKPMKAKDGGQALKGTVDLRMQGMKAFQCRFDAKGNFIDVMALTSDGE